MAAVSSEFFPTYTLTQLSQDQIIEGKMSALLSRKKPRDFYDFYFLLRSNLIPKKRETFEAILASLGKEDIDFDGELKEFLPKNQWAIIRNFKETLEREIKRYL